MLTLLIRFHSKPGSLLHAFSAKGQVGKGSRTSVSSRPAWSSSTKRVQGQLRQHTETIFKKILYHYGANYILFVLLFGLGLFVSILGSKYYALVGTRNSWPLFGIPNVSVNKLHRSYLAETSREFELQLIRVVILKKFDSKYFFN